MTHCHQPKTFNGQFFLAIILNLLFVISEIFYAIKANSTTLLADAGHNFGDIAGLLVAWGANYLLALPASTRYSYGFKKASILASLTNALLLTATASLIAIEAIHKLCHPTPVKENIVIYVALIGMLINGGTALLFMHGAHEDLNIKAAFVHLAADAIIAAGVVFTGIAIVYSKQLWLDPLVSLVIVVIILYNTSSILRDAVNLSLDAIPYHIDHEKVQAYLLSLPGITAIHDLHIWALSTKEIALTAHLLGPETNFTDTAFIAIKKQLQQQFKISHVTLQIEQATITETCQNC
jgi:cobalt-zinc-cadmium efflux system protein